MKIAVFGAGLVGRRHVTEVAQQAELCAIVDPAEGAKALAAEHGVPWFAAPEACLAAMTPDGVIIATPNNLHADQALHCLEKQIPVLIEKPIAGTAADADRIVAASETTGVPVLIGHHRRHNPRISAAKKAIEDSMLGKIVAVNGQFWLYKPDDYFQESWRKQPGAGPLFINFIHDIDLLRYLCGEVVDIQAMRSNAQRGADVEDTAAVILRFKNGALGTFSLSDSVVAPWSWEMTSGENPVYPHHPETCYTIGGTHGALALPQLELWAHPDKRGWWERINWQTLEFTHEDAFKLQLTHFLKVIKGAPPLVSAAEGRASLQVVLEITRRAAL
ncbi:MAG: Gfo/Idh/MocA family oxidoreductase [Pseudomonadota bacterium]